MSSSGGKKKKGAKEDTKHSAQEHTVERAEMNDAVRTEKKETAKVQKQLDAEISARHEVQFREHKAAEAVSRAKSDETAAKRRAQQAERDLADERAEAARLRAELGKLGHSGAVSAQDRDPTPPRRATTRRPTSNGGGAKGGGGGARHAASNHSSGDAHPSEVRER